MKRVLIAGATGGIGHALVRAFVSRNIEVIAFARNAEKLNRMFQHDERVTCVAGDVLNLEELLRASIDIDAIVHAVSFPYPIWEETHIPCITNMLEAAKRNNCKCIIADNIYAYGRQSSPAKEDASKQPHTKKGKLRLHMETLVKESGVPYLIAHVPDVYGPHAVNTILYGTLQAAIKQKAGYFVGRMDVQREYAYTKDVAESIVALTLIPSSYQQNWNIPGNLIITGNELTLWLEKQLGYSPKIRSATPRMIAFLALFSRFMREQKEMMYLTETPVHLHSAKLEKALGVISHTDFTESLIETMNWVKSKG